VNINVFIFIFIDFYFYSTLHEIEVLKRFLRVFYKKGFTA